MKEIPGYEGLFSATEDGQIWSHRKQRFLKPTKSPAGYLYVLIGKDKATRKHVYVHRLVALAYITNPAGKPEINHKDRNRANNRPENLEWVTHAENHQYKWGTMPEEARKRPYMRGKRMGIPAPKDIGAYFPLRPSQKHLIPVFRAVIDQIRGQERVPSRAAAMLG